MHRGSLIFYFPRFFAIPYSRVSLAPYRARRQLRRFLPLFTFCSFSSLEYTGCLLVSSRFSHICRRYSGINVAGLLRADPDWLLDYYTRLFRIAILYFRKLRIILKQHDPRGESETSGVSLSVFSYWEATRRKKIRRERAGRKKKNKFRFCKDCDGDERGKAEEEALNPPVQTRRTTNACPPPPQTLTIGEQIKPLLPRSRTLSSLWDSHTRWRRCPESARDAR